MPSKEEVKKEIRDLIIEITEDLDIDVSKVEDDAHFIDDIGLDSMALLEIVAGMDRLSTVEIPEEELPKLTTINKCVEAIQEYL